MENRQILIRPIITEKSLAQTAAGWYTFAVTLSAKKSTIKKAIEAAFAVKVLSVQTIRMKGKKVRTGRRRLESEKSAWKKAMIKLPLEQKIDLFETVGSEPGGELSAAKAVADKAEEKKK